MAQVFTGDGTLVDAVCLLTFPLLVLLVAKDKTMYSDRKTILTPSSYGKVDDANNVTS